MGEEEKLRRGMSIEDTCRALSGWRFEYVHQRDSSPLCHTWDFIDPFDDKAVVRITFMDGYLLVWGTPAVDPTAP